MVSQNILDYGVIVESGSKITDKTHTIVYIPKKNIVIEKQKVSSPDDVTVLRIISTTLAVSYNTNSDKLLFQKNLFCTPDDMSLTVVNNDFDVLTGTAHVY